MYQMMARRFFSHFIASHFRGEILCDVRCIFMTDFQEFFEEIQIEVLADFTVLDAQSNFAENCHLK